MTTRHHVYAELGPYCDAEGLIAWRAWTVHSLAQEVANRRLLACPTDSGEAVYPAWQFTSDGAVKPDLLPILDALLASADPWTVATWLKTPDENGATILDLLATDDGARRALAEARADAARWAHDGPQSRRLVVG